jgi:hypothetical protein
MKHPGNDILLSLFLILFAGSCLHSFGYTGEPANLRNYDSLADLCKTRYKDAERSENYAAALSAILMYRNYLDSAEMQKLAEVRIKKNSEYKNDLTAAQFDLLRQEYNLAGIRLAQSKIALWGGLVSAILGILITFLIIRQKQFKNNRKTLRVEQHLLLSQMNPHFVLNTLANIQSFIVLRDVEKATQYLDGFSNLAGLILENAAEDCISLQREISIINGYLEIQKVRYGDRFSYTVSVSPDLDVGRVTVPPMLAQPFIENALDHGIRYKEGPGMIHVRFLRQKKWLIVETEDDGVGITASKAKKTAGTNEHHGMTIPTTRARLKNIGPRFGRHGRLEITDLLNPEGTVRGTLVRIMLPE